MSWSVRVGFHTCPHACTFTYLPCTLQHAHVKFLPLLLTHTSTYTSSYPSTNTYTGGHAEPPHARPSSPKRPPIQGRASRRPHAVPPVPVRGPEGVSDHEYDRHWPAVGVALNSFFFLFKYLGLFSSHSVRFPLSFDFSFGLNCVLLFVHSPLFSLSLFLFLCCVLPIQQVGVRASRGDRIHHPRAGRGGGPVLHPRHALQNLRPARSRLQPPVLGTCVS